MYSTPVLNDALIRNSVRFRRIVDQIHGKLLDKNAEKNDISEMQHIRGVRRVSECVHTYVRTRVCLFSVDGDSRGDQLLSLEIG